MYILSERGTLTKRMKIKGTHHRQSHLNSNANALDAMVNVFLFVCLFVLITVPNAYHRCGFGSIDGTT